MQLGVGECCVCVCCENLTAPGRRCWGCFRGHKPPFAPPGWGMRESGWVFGLLTAAAETQPWHWPWFSLLCMCVCVCVLRVTLIPYTPSTHPRCPQMPRDDVRRVWESRGLTFKRFLRDLMCFLASAGWGSLCLVVFVVSGGAFMISPNDEWVVCLVFVRVEGLISACRHDFYSNLYHLRSGLVHVVLKACWSLRFL